MAKKPKSSNGGDAQAEPKAPGQPDLAPGAAQNPPKPQLAVLTQFVRDLSFESPNAPATLQTPGANPKLNLNINVQGTKRGDDVYEVALQFDARATSDGGVIYNVELVYGGLFRLTDIPDNVLQGVLFVDCPGLLFPFLRRIVSQITQDGGYPPLMLDPIDFAALYRNRMQQQQQGTGPAPAAPAGTIET